MFNLKSRGYEWNMVYMRKDIRASEDSLTENLIIRPLARADIPIIVDSFQKIHWQKEATIFEKYLEEMSNDERMAWIAELNGQFAGYVTLKWTSQYQYFKTNNIPEIMDLNVLPDFRHKGIGTALLQTAEKLAAKKSTIIGIGVGLYPDYGSAQKLYIKQGYIPDGRGITYNYQTLAPDQTARLDDDLILWFTKEL